MQPLRSIRGSVIGIGFVLASGCAPAKVNFATIQRPPRPAELDAYEVFIGSWTWEAKMLNAEEADAEWNGTAEWKWALGKTALYGKLSSKSARTEFEAHGAWGWNAAKKTYYFWIANDWGHPQHGTARSDAARRQWTLDYVGVGLDGTKSYGRYTVKVVDDDTLDWTMTEWALPFRLVKKMEMTGVYRRQG